MQQEEASQYVKGLFESWGPSLLRYAHRETLLRELAEDLVQDAFLALYRELRNGKDIANPKGWTVTVLRNQIRKHRRDTKRHGEDLEPGDLLDCRPAKTQKQERPFSELEKHLVGLSKREEEVLLLRLQSLKYREIAAHVGISAKSVATLLARALKKIRTGKQQGKLDEQVTVGVGK